MTTVAYRDFEAQSHMLVSSGGAWSSQVSNSDILCTTIEWFWCGKCVQCRQGSFGSYQPSYKVVLSANISVPIDSRNRPKSLAFGFSYNIAWTASGVYPGMDLISELYVGNDVYFQKFQSYPYSFINWPGGFGANHTIAHWGTIDVEDSGFPVAYVPISIALTFPGASYTYYIVKDAGFLINSPVGSDGFFIGSPSPSPSPSPTPETPTPDSNQLSKARVGAIVGSVIGSTVLIIALVIIYVRLRRNRDSNPHANVHPPAMSSVEGGSAMPHMDPVASYYGANESTMSTTLPWPIPSSPVPTDAHLSKPLPVILPEHSQQPTRDMSETSSIITRPPAYDPVRMQAISPPPWLRTGSTNSGAPLVHRTSMVPEETAEETGLALWARTHRAQIPARLEAKLAAAGYVPADNPNSISDEEWLREYGVTKFELARVQGLYYKRDVA